MFTLCLSGPAQSQTGTVVVQAKDINIGKGGNLVIGFFSQENFPRVGRESFGIVKPVTGTSMQVDFKNIPAGEYGIAIFQDIDRNNDLKTNFIGFPIEPIGFSNDAKIKFGPPSFKDAMIVVKSGSTLVLPIHLR